MQFIKRLTIMNVHLINRYTFFNSNVAKYLFMKLTNITAKINCRWSFGNRRVLVSRITSINQAPFFFVTPRNSLMY